MSAVNTGEKQKIGLVLEGGGMKCAYASGILDCFLEGDINFDYVIGVSAGSANGISFVAKQHGRSLRFYTDHIHDPGYFGVKPLIEQGGIFGLDYIYGDLSSSKGKDPLDYETFAANPTDYEAVATDAATGKSVYFGKDDVAQDDYRAVMASSCLPVVSKPVYFKGRYFYDGGVSDAIPCRRAFERGCTKIVVITSKTRNFVKEPEAHRYAYTRALRDWPNMIDAIDRRHIMYRECQRVMFGSEAGGKAFVYCVPEGIKLSTYNRDENVSLELYNAGRRDYADSCAALRAFLAK